MAAPVIGTQNQSVIRGQKGLNDLQSYQNVPQFIEVEDLWKDEAPLYVISRRAGNLEPVGDDNFFHLEKDQLPQTVTVSGSHNSSVTSIALSSGHGKYVVVGQMLWNPATSEQIQVDAISGDTLTVVRGHGASSGATIAASAKLQIMSMSDTDGNTAPQGLSSTPARKINYLQIEKEAIELTGREMVAETYGKTSGVDYAWELAMKRLHQKMEKTLIFGSLADGTTAGERMTTGGLNHWISSLTIDASGGFTENVLNQFIEAIYQHNSDSDDVLVFGGTNFFAHLDSFGRDRVQYQATTNVHGVRFKRYQTSFGEMTATRHRMFHNTYDDSGTWAGLVYAVPLSCFKVAHFKDRNMMVNKAKQTPDLDGRKDYILNDFGAYLKNEKRFVKMSGIPALF